MNQYLDFERIVLAGKKDFFSARKQFILIPATVIAFLLLIGMVAGNRGPLSNKEYSGFFTALLYAGGLIATAGAFKDRHSRETIHNWLMLPVSTLEKYLVRFLYSTLGVLLISFATIWLSSLLISIANWLLFRHAFTLFNPFLKREIWWGIQGYLAFHSLFFLGAAWFRKNHLVKTLLTLFLFHIFLGAVSGGLGYMFLFRFAMNHPFHLPESFFLNDLLFNQRYLTVFGRLLIQGLIPLSCWTAAYFRLKEAEVKDGV